VTAEAGRLGTPALLAIDDATGGIALRVPSDTTPFSRGTLLRVDGTLSAPYGQLEIKPLAHGLTVMGVGALPGAIPVGPDSLDESLEGRLVVASGVLMAKPKRTSGGDLTITLNRESAGPLRLIADASSQIGQDSFSVGTAYQVIGVVGQRASRKGAPDGYRICLRDPLDVTAGGSAAAGAPSGEAGPAVSGAPGSTGRLVTIGQALATNDVDVTIEAVVTAPSNLLDTSGRRIVVQDAGAAIELLLPAGDFAPPIGTRIRADGRVGLAYGAPRLRAEKVVPLTGGRVPTPIVLHGQPGLAHEWRLVSITGRIEKVSRLGDRWRAELAIGGRTVPIVGQPGSGIAAGTLVEGRIATVVGIARRPFPTATDRRFAILPRSMADVRVAGGSIVRQLARGGSPSGIGAGGRGAIATIDPAGARAGVPDADLADLGTFVGRVVRVGGLVSDLRPDGVRLDDGTAIGRIVLRGDALALLPLLEPEDAINATGRVDTIEDGLAVIVDDPAGITQAGDPQAPGPLGTPDPAAAADAGGPASEAGLATGPSFGAGAVGFVTLVLLSVVSLAVTLGRRWRLRRHLDARIAARLAGLEPPPDPTARPRSAERRGGTLHSA
jgi:hypothetical protein